MCRKLCRLPGLLILERGRRHVVQIEVVSEGAAIEQGSEMPDEATTFFEQQGTIIDRIAMQEIVPDLIE